MAKRDERASASKERCSKQPIDKRRVRSQRAIFAQLHRREVPITLPNVRWLERSA